MKRREIFVGFIYALFLVFLGTLIGLTICNSGAWPCQKPCTQQRSLNLPN